MSLYRSVLSIAVARTLGMLAAFAFNMFVAYRFGSDRATDIAFAALAVPAALMVIVGTLFPPIFTATFKSIEVTRGVGEAWIFGRSAPKGVGLGAAGVAMAGLFLSPLLSLAVAGGFAPDEIDRVTSCMRLAFALVFFVTVESVLKGILNARGSFFIPSLDTFAANVVAILVIAAATASWGEAAIVGGVVAGGLVKVLILVPGYRAGRPGGPSPFIHPALGGFFGPVVLYCVLFAVQTGLQRALAGRIEGEGAVTCLNFAEKLLSVPQELCIVSMGIVLLPSLAARAAEGNMTELRRLVGLGARMSFFLALPAAVGMVVLAEPLVVLLFQRGLFDAADTAQTAATLVGFSGAMVFTGIVILYQAFYALRAPGPLLISGIVIAAVNAAGGLLLVGPLGAAGLAIAFSLSYAVGFAVALLLFARRAGGWPDLPALLAGFLRAAFCAAGMGLCLWGIEERVHLPVLIRVAGGAAIYAVLARFACPGEWKLLRGLWGRAGP